MTGTGRYWKVEGQGSESKQVMYDVVQEEKDLVSEPKVNDRSGGFRKLFNNNLQSGTRRNLKWEILQIEDTKIWDKNVSCLDG